MDSLQALGVQFTPAELSKLKAVLFPEEPMVQNLQPQKRVVSDSAVPVRPLKPTELNSFVDQVSQYMEDIEKAAKTIGDRDDYVEQVQHAIIEALDGFSKQIQEEQDELDRSMLTKLDNCIQMYNILEGYNLELMQEPENAKVSKLLNRCAQQEKPTSLVPYMDPEDKLSQIHKHIQQFESMFTPIFREKAILFGQVCVEFWSWMSLVFDYRPRNTKLASILPTQEVAAQLVKCQMSVEDMLPHLVAMSPMITNEVEEETKNIIRFAQSRVQELAKISESIIRLCSVLDITEPDQRVIFLLQYASESTLLDKKALLQVSKNVGLSRDAIDEFNGMVTELNLQKQAKEAKLQNLKDRCLELWSVLDEDTRFIERFMNQNCDLSDNTFNRFENEIERLQVLKKKHISKFIQQARSKIEQYWNTLMYSNEQRKQFGPYWETRNFTDELLEEHEKEILRLRERMAQLKPILEAIQELEALLEEKHQLTESCRNPNRLRQRNSFKLLREEEKTRERLQVLLPQTFSSLRKMLVEYEQNNGYSFMVEDQPYIEKLDELEEKAGIKKKPLRKTPLRTRATRSLSAPRIGQRESITKPVQSRSLSRTATRTLSDPFCSRSVSPLKRNLNNSKATLSLTTTSHLPPVESTRAVSSSPSRLRPPSASVIRTLKQRELNKENEIMTLSPIKPKLVRVRQPVAAPEILSSDDEDAPLRPVSNWRSIY